MTTIELPSWANGSWDICEIEAIEVPGLVSVEVSRGPKWDRKEASGQTGEKATFKGYRGADVTIKVRLWTQSQETAFETSILPVIDPQPGKESPKAVTIAYPGLALRKVEAIHIEDVVGPKIDDDAQFVEYEIKAFEYRRPVKQQGTPGKPGQTACQQAKAEYDHWTAEANRLGSKGLADFDSAEAYEQGQRDYAAARDRARYAGENLVAGGCQEASPGVEAGARGGEGGGLPPP